MKKKRCGVSLHIEELLHLTQREQSMSHPTEEKHDKSKKWEIVT